MKYKILILFLFGIYSQLQAYNTVGSTLNSQNFYQENLTKLTWSAKIEEYQYIPLGNGTYHLRLDFQGVNFVGNNGWASITTIIQNTSHDFTTGIVGSAFTNPPTISTPPGVGLYLSHLRGDIPYNQQGIELLANPDAYPRFSHIFEDVNGAGLVGRNIYTRDIISQPTSNMPHIATWIVEKTGTVTNPTGNFSKDTNGNWIDLVGEFAIWNFKITLDGTTYEIANYYLPVDNASYLRPDLPLTLAQDYFGSVGEELHNMPSSVKYYNLIASNSSNQEFNLNDWKIIWKTDDGAGNLDQRYGWGIVGDSLLSSSGHESDLALSREIEQILVFEPNTENSACTQIVNLNIADSTSGVYQAGEQLLVTGQVDSEKHFNLKSEETITFSPPFSIGSGSTLNASISTCTPKNIGTIKPNIIVVSESSNQDLASYSENQLVFNTSAQQYNLFANNCILISEPTTNAPNGYLRKITSLTHSGNQVIINTTPASLLDIFEEVNYSTNIPLQDDSFSQINGGNSSNFTSSGVTYKFQLDSFNITEGVDLKGEIELIPNYDFDLVIDKSKRLENFLIGLDTKVKASVKLSIKDPLLFSISKERIWRNIKLRPICLKIPTAFFGIPIPIIIVPEIEIYSKVELENKAVNLKLINEGDIRIASRYINGKWVNDSKNELSLLNTELDADLELAGKLTAGGIKFNFKLFDLGNLSSHLEGEVNAGFSVTPQKCYLFSSLDAGGGITLDIASAIGIKDLSTSFSKPILTDTIDFGNCLLAEDIDEDGIADDIDNCPNIMNHDQADTDGDGIGDVCDLDVDGDGNINEDCISTNPDGDSDDDGIPNNEDIAPCNAGAPGLGGFPIPDNVENMINNQGECIITNPTLSFLGVRSALPEQAQRSSYIYIGLLGCNTDRIQSLETGPFCSGINSNPNLFDEIGGLTKFKIYSVPIPKCWPADRTFCFRRSNTTDPFISFTLSSPKCTNLSTIEVGKQLLNNDNSFQQVLTLYPNPVKEQLEIVYDIPSKFDITIYDSKGIEVLNRKTISNRTTLNLQSLPKGMYFMNIIIPETGEKLYEKIVKK